MSPRKQDTEKDRDASGGDDAPRRLASPPCLMGEVDPAYMGLPPDPAPKPARRRKRR
jgi:hypothetical protein